MTQYYLKNRGSKYKNTPKIIDGIRFDSKLEASYYLHLKLLQSQGIVKFFLRQPAFHLSSDVTYRADFQIFYTDGLVDFVDVKGYETETFKIKKKLVEDKYPVTLTIITKGKW